MQSGHPADLKHRPSPAQILHRAGDASLQHRPQVHAGVDAEGGSRVIPQGEAGVGGVSVAPLPPLQNGAQHSQALHLGRAQRRRLRPGHACRSDQARRVCRILRSLSQRVLPPPRKIDPAPGPERVGSVSLVPDRDPDGGEVSLGTQRPQILQNFQILDRPSQGLHPRPADSFPEGDGDPQR